jgi:hypothetical protein
MSRKEAEQDDLEDHRKQVRRIIDEDRELLDEFA